ncbi:toxin ParE1/3/4 [Sphingomonas sp. BE270]|uniref:type II toxin-antitoxin system RelE/ParE family toxin n=1 Tax=unclassified Sphingomonas TaxID=196159 RepID=UPI00053E5296|nr:MULTISPECIES: type II toxin-antitoxin system RelE/ParE family toxin [unclassified Sphingomonas]MDR6848299.1 toxin ParE1/3/4 [Sphingomonas sp. BE137]MDR7258961.1 toxin ParE1/3/4 [Sphingomonas sp. BE270]
MKPVYRAASVRDIDGIFDYSVTTHGPEVAKAYLRDIDAAIARLLDYPEIGIASGLRQGVRSIAAREHRIYYRIDGSKLVIARVLHKAMDPARCL